MILIQRHFYLISVTSTLKNNSAHYGGVVYTYIDYASFSIITCILVNNRATVSGGIIWVLRTRNTQQWTIVTLV